MYPCCCASDIVCLLWVAITLDLTWIFCCTRWHDTALLNGHRLGSFSPRRSFFQIRHDFLLYPYHVVQPREAALI